VFTRTFGVLSANFGPFFLLALLFNAAPTAAVNLGLIYVRTIFDVTDLALVRLAAGLVQMALSSVLTAALVRGAIVDLDGRKASFGDSLAIGMKFALPALVMAVISTLCYLVAAFLFFIPFVFLALMWSASTQVLVIERKGIFGSFGRSAQLTQGHRWSLLGLWICVWLLLIVLSLPVGMVSGFAGAMLGGNIYAIVLVGAVIGALEAMFVAVISTAAYAELRGSREGVSVTQLASVFD
jgi:hypothetical protein